MSEPSDPREPTPHMRRLAASMSRSRDALRTLPGMLSRSLAPSAGGKHRIWRDLRLMLVALVPFVVAVVVMVMRGGHGAWVIVQAAPPPWQADAGIDPRIRELIGETVVFERTRLRGPDPFACKGARYREFDMAVQGVFQGALSDDPRLAQRAATLGLDGPEVRTLRIDCDNASFDFHRVDNRLLLMLDGAILRLVPR
ncbi:hypothetical protein [Pseudofulvimonas gallinarii]|jgi:hypothetical protein|uniref:Uncharacterized protein n=1 Tax=Pseudofulvimonas gallinarii TaxID=634155 RepID=A0A4R3LDU7_9GAMM|nr:hypothetical protein [Pseudofulvimonas gallinarii]TCS97560.1 hypothetical protein EDC25_11241 [Pseudofulvimonas gallinarii]THD13459.1 hypothetical protein B1808_08035 [Pseudofulvimonas gallinarii]